MEEILAGMAAFLGIVLVITIVLAVITIIANWKLFEKAGEPGWSAIIPFYSNYQMAKIATGNDKLSWAFVILSVINVVLSNSKSKVLSSIAILCSLAFLVIACYVYYKYAESFGQSTAMCVLSIFFAPIIFMIMAFNNNTEYVGPNGVSSFKGNSYGGNGYGGF